MSAFVKPLDYYSRDYDIVGNYKQSIVHAVSLALGEPLDKVKAYIEDKMATTWIPKSPDIHTLARVPRGDRQKKKASLLSYLDWVTAKKHILAPNLICYANPKVEESFLSGFIANNLATRKAVKKEGQQAFMDGDHLYATFCNLLQANFKIRNNSISGALSSPYNPLYYASSYTSLTSVCRAITSYANACNEKLMASNRHYFTPEVTKENLAYLTSHCDMIAVEETMSMFRIAPPTVDYLYEQVLYSTRLYWEDEHHEAVIRRMIENMSDTERAAVSFTGDLHALHQTNDKAMRLMYDSLTRRPMPVMDKDMQVQYQKSASDDDVALASLLSADFMAGKKAKDLTEEERGVWIGYIKQVVDTFSRYKPLIDAFISTRIMPSSIHSLPTIVRRVVVGSDTDSSIFSTQKQVKWYTGKIDFSHAAVQAGAITSYIASQHIVHTLACLSGQMAVEEEQLFRLSMKSEFFSRAQINTSITKTYAMDISACEGSVYPEPELEMKGVLLKSSKLPTPVRREIERFTWYCLNAPNKEGGISPMEPAAILAKIEHMLLARLRAGNTMYFKTEQIKTPATYAAGENATQVVCKDLWNELFGAEKGIVEQLPADAYKVNVDLGKMAKIIEYGDKLGANRKAKLLDFMHQRGKKSMTQLLAPGELMEKGRIPKELLWAMDERKMLFSLVQPLYILANALSLNIANSKFTHFWSDDITEAEADKWLPEDYNIEI